MELVADDPDEAERQVGEAMERWSSSGFHRQHYNNVYARIQIELYCGLAEPAWKILAGNWNAIERALLRRIRHFRIETSYVRARCALLMAASGVDARRFLSIARRDARRIAGEKMRWSDPFASLLNAAIAYLEDDPRAAAERLRAAADGFEREHMQLYAAVARRRLDQMTSDDPTLKRRSKADEWMAAQGIVNPARMTRLFAPGFSDTGT
jgi:eukaryotic-like serine/threonine-protein kinase